MVYTPKPGRPGYRIVCKAGWWRTKPYHVQMEQAVLTDHGVMPEWRTIAKARSLGKAHDLLASEKARRSGYGRKEVIVYEDAPESSTIPLSFPTGAIKGGRS